MCTSRCLGDHEILIWFRFWMTLLGAEIFCILVLLGVDAICTEHGLFHFLYMNFKSNLLYLKYMNTISI